MGKIIILFFTKSDNFGNQLRLCLWVLSRHRFGHTDNDIFLKFYIRPDQSSRWVIRMQWYCRNGINYSAFIRPACRINAGFVTFEYNSRRSSTRPWIDSNRF